MNSVLAQLGQVRDWITLSSGAGFMIVVAYIALFWSSAIILAHMFDFRRYRREVLSDLDIFEEICASGLPRDEQDERTRTVTRRFGNPFRRALERHVASSNKFYSPPPPAVEEVTLIAERCRQISEALNRMVIAGMLGTVAGLIGCLGNGLEGGAVERIYFANAMMTTALSLFGQTVAKHSILSWLNRLTSQIRPAWENAIIQAEKTLRAGAADDKASR